MSETTILYLLAASVLAAPLTLYIIRQSKREKRIREAVAGGTLSDDVPPGLHPHIDVSNCIGCQGCTSVCPEGGVLGMVGGKAAVVRPHRCIGHGLCADACPVGAITLVRARPGISSALPFLTPDYETNVEGLYIAGELGGLALIKNAVEQGRDCVDSIASRLASSPVRAQPGVYDLIIVGAGPAGISASLRATERKLNYLTIERGSVGGSVTQYPRQKLVMTSPVEFPMGARLSKIQLSKESLLAFWTTLCAQHGFHVQVNETVEIIAKEFNGVFNIVTDRGEYKSRAIVLAMGRAGTPRKLGIKGEELPKVMYRLLEADHYINRKILVTGGGDSAVESALGLAMQRGNQVTLSYRKSSFSRIKERNSKKLHDALRAGKLTVLYDSQPVEIREASVILNVAGTSQEIPNDLVWIFAGGIAPNDFLKRAGIHFGPRDITIEAVKESAVAHGEPELVS